MSNKTEKAWMFCNYGVLVYPSCRSTKDLLLRGATAREKELLASGAFTIQRVSLRKGIWS